MANKTGVLVGTQGMLLLLLGVTVAGAQIGRAELSGTIADQTEAVLPGAVIVATHVATGAIRETVSDDRGNYVLPSLEVGEYTVAVELPGFAPATRTGVNLLIGQRATIDIILQPAGISSEVNVTAETPLVETGRSDIGANIDVRQMNTLPLVGRDWLSMTATAPGVRSSRQGIPSVGAQGNRRTGVFIDGGSIKNSTGRSSVAINYSQEVIREVQVIASRMSAEYGNAAGGVVSAVTKSGTNQLSGSVYGFFRDAKFNADDFFTNTKEPFSNKNYGATIGGPFVRDKLFFFGNVEQTRRTQNAAISVGVPELDRQYPRGFKDTFAFARFDAELLRGHRLSVPTAYNFNTEENNAANLIPLLDFDTQTWSAGAQVTSVIGARLLNEFRYNFLPSNWQRKLHTEFIGLQFPRGRIGQQQNAPWVAAAHYNQLSNSTTYNFVGHGTHTLRAGVSYDYENMYGIFGNQYFGEYLFSQNPTNWSAVIDVVNRNDRVGLQNLVNQGIVPVPTVARQGIGDITYRTPQSIVGFYVQEDWRTNDRLTLNLGIRWDADLGDYSPGFETRFTQTYGFPDTDLDNWAPRLGFAWDLTGQGDTVVRGGAGRYYDLHDNNIIFANRIFNGDTYAIATTFPGNPPRGDFMINNLGSLTLQQIVEQNLAPSDLRQFHRDLESAYTDQMTIGISRQLTENLGVQADFLHIIGLKQLIGYDINVFCAPVAPIQGEGNSVTSDVLPVARFGRPDPRFNVINMIHSNGHTRYEGLQTALNKRFSRNFQFVASYTLSWSYSDSPDIGTGLAGGFCDPSVNKGFSPSDQRHRATWNVVYQLPYGFQVGGVVFAASGQRFAVVAGRDLDGNLDSRDDLARFPDGTRMPRAFGLSGSNFRVDLRLTKTFNLLSSGNIELIAEFFNVFNRENYDPQSYQGSQAAGNFLQPRASTDLNFQPFQAQFAVRYRF